MPEEATVEFRRVWYLNGPPPKYGIWTRPRFAVKSPPTNGWSIAAVLRGESRSTIFCPYSLRAFDVPNYCDELLRSMEAPTASPAKMAGLITGQWEMWQRHGYQVDYDVAALVLTRLGFPVPTRTVDPADEGIQQGGKDYDEDRLRVIRRDSKRGQVVASFMTPEPTSVREVMARLGMTRSNVLSHLFCAQRDNGVGYALVGDCALIELPEGWDPFEEPEAPACTQGSVPEEPSGATAAVESRVTDLPRATPTRAGKGPAGKPCDPSRLSPINPSSKRGAVARAFSTWHSLDDYATSSGLTRSGVLSHLYTIWQVHGLGHEVSEDGKQARLSYPTGHALFDENLKDGTSGNGRK